MINKHNAALTEFETCYDTGRKCLNHRLKVQRVLNLFSQFVQQQMLLYLTESSQLFSHRFLKY